MWKYIKDDLPEIGSRIVVAQYCDGNPQPDYFEKDIESEEDVKSLYAESSRRDMFKYLRRKQYIDLYKIENVNFSIIEPDSPYWEEFRAQRIERGFDDSELWNLDVTIVQFILPRLKAFRDKKFGFPAAVVTEKKWKSILSKMIYFFENYKINDFIDDKKKMSVHKRKMTEGKNLFFRYFSALWD